MENIDIERTKPVPIVLQKPCMRSLISREKANLKRSCSLGLRQELKVETYLSTSISLKYERVTKRNHHRDN